MAGLGTQGVPRLDAFVRLQGAGFDMRAVGPRAPAPAVLPATPVVTRFSPNPARSRKNRLNI